MIATDITATDQQAVDGDQISGVFAGETPLGGRAVLFTRILALSLVGLVVPFLLNNYLKYWQDWPGGSALFGSNDLEGGDGFRAFLQILLYILPLVYIVLRVIRTPHRTLQAESWRFTALSAYIVRAAFWSVLMVGLADMFISFLRVESLLAPLVGDALTTRLGQANFRGPYVHFPLIGLACIIAYFFRSLSFVWMAALIVIAEFLIVISRFVFSYEQAFMGDLVRFWYASLFLFASAYTLLEEAHVRVDILYTRFSVRGKAWTNMVGSLVLGMPLCWVILTRGMWDKANVINAPLLTFEVSQSGYGMFTKYLMAAFLIVYALSMLVQFASYFMSSAGILLREYGPTPDPNHIVI